MLTVERRWIRHIKPAGGSVDMVVDPASEMEGIRGHQVDQGIEAENLIKQDRLDGDLAIALLVDLDVGLILCQTEVIAEGRIGRSACQ